MDTRQVMFRLAPEEIQLLDAWVKYRRADLNISQTRADVLRAWLKTQPLPQVVTPESRQLRRAHRECFPYD